MTVAIAALCGVPNDVMVVAAEDRMVTSGDIEFEQPQPKIWRLGQYCVALFFGSSAAQAEIASRTESIVRDSEMMHIHDIATTYAGMSRDYIRRQAEADILSPLGLSSADLLKNPPRINRVVLEKLTQQMQLYYEGSGLSEHLGGAIVIGSDEGGGHIYQVEHGKAVFMDRIGFVAGGAGQRHAESQFMFAKYTSHWSFSDALSLLYAAKKRAEVTPGVGSETDIVIVTTRPQNVIHFPHGHDFVRGLERIYQEHRRLLDEDFTKQHQRVGAFLDEHLARAREAASPMPSEAGQPTPDDQVTQSAPPKTKRGRKGRTPSRE